MRKHFWILWIMITTLAGIYTFAEVTKPAQAQQIPSLQERQVRALEQIANEMSRMRRDRCR